MLPPDRFLRHLIETAPHAKALGERTRAGLPFTMLSAAELYALDALLHASAGPLRIAELGAFVGGGTALLAGEAPEGSIVEVYDLFEHNAGSRARLKADPLYDDASFFAIWARNTRPFAGRIALHRGDLRATATASAASLDLLFVDLVKHPSLVNPMVAFYRRLRIGGLLMHQDYFHFQSPWLVYQMEELAPWFEELGDLGANMAVYRKRAEPPADLPDFLALDRARALAGFDRAIARRSGARAGLLRVSKLRLLLGWDPEAAGALADEIARRHAGAPRVLRYLEAVRGLDESRLW